MARTKASVGAKVASGKSSKARCSAAPPPSSSGSSGSSERSSRNTSGGGNSVCPRETPKWQRPITNFFINKDTSGTDEADDGAGSSSSKPKRNVIESDEEDSPKPKQKRIIESDNETPEKADEPPKNKVLDETIELEPLSGEDSHKIEEFYPVNGVKGKGVGKKTNKDIIDNEENPEKTDKTPKNKVLEETIDLETVSGEDNNKIEEIYPSNGVKDKGVGKKTNKENVDSNVGRKSLKRELEEVEIDNVSKKVKVN